MKRRNQALGLALVASLAAIAIGAAPSTRPSAGHEFDVTVTNLTAGQIFSPLLVVSHTSDIALFELGQPASAELATLAEEGQNGPLAALAGMLPGVLDVASGDFLMPGASETIRVRAQGIARRISLAGMLVSSNDAFVAVDGVAVPKGHAVTVVHAVAYDAGSERNSESCAWVPGPPCGSADAHDPSPAEGFVYVSSGIHGIEDLSPAVRDWNNPVALVTIRRAQ